MDRPGKEIILADTVPLLEQARQLLVEYTESIGVSLAFQHIDAELGAFPGDYTHPDGAVLLALVDGELAACACLRRWDRTSGEMKRLFVRPAHRGLGLGKDLVIAVIQQALALNYRELRLDTLESMKGAQKLYRSLGFREIPPYGTNHLPGTQFFAINLGD